MKNYNLEKKRYANIAARCQEKGDPAILAYEGKNIFIRILKKIVGWKKYHAVMQDNHSYIASLAVVTSYACNQNCRGCGQHEPLIKKLPPEKLYINMRQIKEDLDKISLAVDKIGGIAVANGEGFLNRNLSELIDYYSNNPRILRMNVPTNGSIIPQDELLDKISQNGITCTITEYKSVSAEQRNNFIQKLEQHNVKYTVFKGRKWYLHEYDENLKVSEQGAQDKYRHCERFFMLMDGELWKCVPDATRVKAGLRPRREGDSICVKDSSIEEVRKFIEEKSKASYLESCLYCRGCYGSDVIEIPAGEQMKGSI